MRKYAFISTARAERRFNQAFGVEPSGEWRRVFEEGSVNRSIAGRTAQRLAELQDHDLLMLRTAGEPALAQAPAARPAEPAPRELQQLRASLLSEIPEPWRGHYERITARYGRAVVPVRDHTCLGCYTRVPAGLTPHTRDLPAITRCEGCGRLLLWLPSTPSRPDRTR